MSTLTKTRVVYARSDTSVTTDLGVPVALRRGEAWDGNDPLVKQRPECFSDSPLVRTSDRGWIVLEGH